MDDIAMVEHDFAVLIAFVQDAFEDGIKIRRVFGVRVVRILDDVDYLVEGFFIEQRVLQMEGLGLWLRLGFVVAEPEGRGL